jgi:hypothetical protein
VTRGALRVLAAGAYQAIMKARYAPTQELLDAAGALACTREEGHEQALLKDARRFRYLLNLMWRVVDNNDTGSREWDAAVRALHTADDCLSLLNTELALLQDDG